VLKPERKDIVMGRLLSEPWVIGSIIVLAMLLFAAPKLPSMARNIGQSMRIFKSEVRELKNDEANAASTKGAGQSGSSPAQDHAVSPVESRRTNAPE
jgi:sec-independent protein translocase protein TatA